MKRRGFSMVEVMTASFMALVVVGALVSVYLNSLRLQREARETYFISEEVALLLDQVSADLEGTALHSIVVWDDGFSLFSPYDLDSDEGFEVTVYGAPVWKKVVHFRLEDADQNTCRLLRWEEPLQNQPLPPAISKPGAPGRNARVLVTNVLRPGVDVSQRADGVFELRQKLDAPGGFELAFLRKDETRSADNPASFTDETRPGWTAGNTRLVELSLTVVNRPSDSKISVLGLRKVFLPAHP